MVAISISPSDLQAFEQCYIDERVVDLAGIYRVDNQAGADLIGRKASNGTRFDGVVFPYRWPGDTLPREYRLRRDTPDYEQKANGEVKQVRKYLSPPGRGNLLYFSPEVNPKWLKDSGVRAVFVEGEKKTLALQRYFSGRGEECLVIGLAGVSGWRGKIGVTTGPNGERVDVKGMIGDFGRISWEAREVEILFDADASAKPDVDKARRSLAFNLRLIGASVRILNMPALEETGCKGIDDLLGKSGPEFVADWLNAERQSSVPGADLGYSDAGFLNRFYEVRPDDFFYVSEWDKWTAWTGAVYESENGTALLWEAVKAASLHFQATEGLTAADPDKFAKFCARYRSSTGIRSLVDMARNDMRFRKPSSEFDKHPHLFNCKNGTLNLDTGQLQPFDRDDYLTNLGIIAYNPEAECSNWKNAIWKYMSGNQDLVNYLQRFLGYCLSGYTREQIFAVAHGDGQNGKGTITRIMNYILGNGYFKSAAAATFYRKADQGGHTDDLAGLHGSRLVVASEVEEGKKLDEGMIKRITGDDTLRVSFKSKSFFEYKPAFKVILAVNHLPRISGRDFGIWRRVHKIPFDYKIPDQDRLDNPTFEDDLLAEAEGILAWLVRGFAAYRKDGLQPPQVVVDAVADYKKDTDIIGDFVEHFCIFGEREKCAAKYLYAAYEKSCEGVEEPISMRAFAHKLEERGCAKKHTEAGSAWTGIDLKEGVKETIIQEVTEAEKRKKDAKERSDARAAYYGNR